MLSKLKKILKGYSLKSHGLSCIFKSFTTAENTAKQENAMVSLVKFVPLAILEEKIP